MKNKIALYLSIFGLSLVGCSSLTPTSHEHTYSDSWSYDETYHWHQATCEHKEEIKDKAIHQFGEWIIDTPPTEYSEGLKHRDCLICDYSVQKTIERLEHTHVAGTPVEENRIEPTCTHNGSYDLVTYCSVCHEEIKREHKTIPATGHEQTAIREENRVEPTCTKSGSYDEVTYCVKCDAEISRVSHTIPATGHQHIETRKDNVIAAACTEPGSYDLVTYCADDDFELSREHIEVEALGHSFVTVEEKLPTCTEDGHSSYQECTRCKEKQGYEVIPATGHQHLTTVEENRIEPTCTKEGSYDVVTYCIDDDYEISRVKHTIEALGHDYEKISETEPTYEEDGLITYECKRCHDIKTEKGESKLKHNYSDVWSHDETKHWHYCIDEGYETLKGNESTHSFSDWAITVSPTETEDGVEQRTCSVCSYLEERAVERTGTLTKLTFTKSYNNYMVKASSNTISGKVVIPSQYNGLPVTVINENGFSGCNQLTSVELPDSIIHIGQNAFSNSINLESVILSKNITYISRNTFNNCSSLRSIVIPDKVTYIDQMAFFNCSSLSSVDLGSGLKDIYYGAFLNCFSLVSITLPESLINIGGYAFDGCYRLVEVINKSSLDIKVGFDDSVGRIGLYAKQIIKDKTESKIVVDGDYITYADGEDTWLVQYIGSDKQITIPDKINKIISYAFYGQRSLTEITISSGVTELGENTFGNCVLLATINLPAGIKSLGYRCFYGVQALSEIELPDELEFIDEEAFSGCTNLTSITIPNGVTEIKNFTFIDCISLETVVLGENLTSIGYGAFQGCSSLLSLDVPNTVISIGESAFNNASLSEINYDGTLEEWSNITKGKNWNKVVSSLVVHCLDGDEYYNNF